MMSVTFHTLLPKCIKIAEIANFEFQEFFFQNFKSKSEFCWFYSPYSNFEFCYAASPVWLSALVGLLEFHYLLIYAPAIYIRKKRKQACPYSLMSYVLMSTFWQMRTVSLIELLSYSKLTPIISLVVAEGTVLCTEFCIIPFLKTPTWLKVVNRQIIFQLEATAQQNSQDSKVTGCRLPEQACHLSPYFSFLTRDHSY